MSKRTFWTIIISCHAMAALWQLCINTTYTRDSYEYLDAAQNLTTSHTLYAGKLTAPVNERLYTKRPAGYPFILALFDLLSCHHQGVFMILLLLAQNLLSLFNIRLITRLLQQQSGAIPWTILGVLIIFSPAQIIYANMVMSEIWLQSVIVVTAYCIIHYRKTFNLKIAGVVSLCIVFGMLLKPVMAPAVLLWPVIMLFYALKKRQYLMVPIALFPLLCYLGYCQWNKHRTGYAQFSSITTINLLHYNTYGVLQKVYGTVKADSIIDNIRAQAEKKSGFAAGEAFINSECRTILSDHKITYGFMHAKGMVLFFLDPGRFDMASFSGTDNQNTGLLQAGNTAGNTGMTAQLRQLPTIMIILMLVTGLANIIKAIGLFVFAIDRRFPLYLKLTCLSLILYLCILTGPLGASRFVMPVLPLIWLACAMVYSKLKPQQP